MAKEDLKFKIVTDPDKAIAGMAKAIAKLESVNAKLKKVNKTGKKTKPALGGFGKVAGDVGKMAAGFITAQAAIAGAKKVLGAFVSSLQEAVKLRKQFSGMAMTADERALGLADLRGDVTDEGIDAAKKYIANLAKKTGITRDPAKSIIFFSESQLGANTPEAAASALSIAKFAGPAGLDAESVKMIPKILGNKPLGADTPEEIEHVLDVIKKTSLMSVATPGELLPAIMKFYDYGMGLGFKHEELMAMMATAVAVTGSVEEAATHVLGGLQISKGKTTKALEFYGEAAKKRGKDWGQMEAPERYAFVSELYQEAEEKSPAAKDEFTVKVGGKGEKYVAAMLGESGQELYRGYLDQINEPEIAGLNERTFQDYKTTRLFKQRVLQIQGEEAKETVAIKRRAEVALEKITGDILEISHANLESVPDHIKAGLTLDSLEKSAISRMVVRESLRVAKEKAKPGTPGYAELQRLENELPGIGAFSIFPDYVEEAYKATSGFSMDGHTGSDIASNVDFYLPTTYAGGRKVYQEGFKEYFGISQEATTVEKENTDAIKEHTTALQDNTAALLRASSGLGRGIDRQATYQASNQELD